MPQFGSYPATSSLTASTTALVLHDGSVKQATMPTLQSGVLSLSWYGADPTGVADSTTALVAAIAACQDGGTILVDGVYAINHVEITKSIRFIGMGITASRFVRTDASSTATSDMILIQGTESVPISFVEFSGISFDQKWIGTDAGSTFSCICIYRSNSIIIKDCYFTRGQYHGVKINGSFNVRVTGNYFYQCRYDGIGIGGPVDIGERRSKNIVVSDNVFEDVYGGVITQVGVDDVSIVNNTFIKSSIQFGQDCTNVLIDGNKIRNARNSYGSTVATNWFGIFVEACDIITITNNQVADVTGSGTNYGIWVDGSILFSTQMEAKRIVVANNTIRTIGNAGIIITAQSEDSSILGTNVSVTDNLVFEAGEGIAIVGVDGAMVSGNRINLTQFSGLVLSLVQHVTVIGNSIINVSTSSANSYNGINITNNPATDIHLLSNIIIDNRASKFMRFGVFDERLNGGNLTYVKSFGNIISGTASGIPYQPLPAIPSSGTLWAKGDTIQQFSDDQGGAEFFMNLNDTSPPGVWQPCGQIGYKTGNATPVGAITPSRIGEMFLDEVNDEWYISYGTSDAEWKQIT